MTDNFGLSYSEMETLIDEWILNQRNRSIVKRKLLDGITYDRLSIEFDLTPTQIARIVKKAKATLENRIKNDTKNTKK